MNRSAIFIFNSFLPKCTGEWPNWPIYGPINWHRSPDTIGPFMALCAATGKRFLSHECQSCSEWDQVQAVEARGKSVSEFPCVQIAYQVTRECEMHPDPHDCPDN